MTETCLGGWMLPAFIAHKISTNAAMTTVRCYYNRREDFFVVFISKGKVFWQSTPLEVAQGTWAGMS